MSGFEFPTSPLFFLSRWQRFLIIVSMIFENAEPAPPDQ